MSNKLDLYQEKGQFYLDKYSKHKSLIYFLVGAMWGIIIGFVIGVIIGFLL